MTKTKLTGAAVAAVMLMAGIAAGQNLSQEETELYNLIMEYRAEKGLPTIPLSGALTVVAQAHVRDLAENYDSFASGCNMHSWSNRGNWTACCYTSDHAQAACMWNKPRELTSYRGNGYEISHSMSSGATARSAINGWKNSPPHNAVMINEGTWARRPWGAVGIGIYGRFANVWFGQEPDESASVNTPPARANVQGQGGRPARDTVVTAPTPTAATTTSSSPTTIQPARLTPAAPPQVDNVPGTWANIRGTERFVFNADGTGVWHRDDREHNFVYTATSTNIALTMQTPQGVTTKTFSRGGRDQFMDENREAFRRQRR